MRTGRALAGALAAAGCVVLARRRARARREHVDVYYSDGSMVSLEAGTPAGDRLLALARSALAATRTS